MQMDLRKQVGVAILLSDKRDLKPKLMRKERKELHVSKKKKFTKKTLQFFTSMHQK